VRIHAISTGSDNMAIKAWQVSDVIGFWPTKARARISPIDGADMMRVKVKPSVRQPTVWQTPHFDIAIFIGKAPIWQILLNGTQQDLRNRYLGACWV
jgi:hypothetical protein